MKRTTGSLRPAVSDGNRRPFHFTVLHLIILAVLVGLNACNPDTEAVAVGDDDIGGVVRGPNGPEAGVWVIAETFDLPTRFARIVVTDDKGQYLIPDLPDANYTVW
ncbi:MAG TPA: carboxypeptidase-like regulatory domain-containing protein, partial [Cyclobacteriaceae bacterium]